MSIIAHRCCRLRTRAGCCTVRKNHQQILIVPFSRTAGKCRKLHINTLCNMTICCCSGAGIASNRSIDIMCDKLRWIAEVSRSVGPTDSLPPPVGSIAPPAKLLLMNSGKRAEKKFNSTGKLMRMLLGSLVVKIGNWFDCAFSDEQNKMQKQNSLQNYFSPHMQCEGIVLRPTLIHIYIDSKEQ